MATNKSTGGSTPSTIALDADLAARLVAALETIGSAIDSGQGNGTRALAHPTGPVPDPVRSRAARDYDVLRGVLGRAGAPHGLSMHRDKTDIVVDNPLPVSATYAIVESPGTPSSGPVAERVIADPTVNRLNLDEITQDMSISRVEVFDCDGRFLAFGPSLLATIDFSGE
ncbi:hypothetical protein BJ973_004060 [Actinoplanes tereljensis]|uniref:Uncharacterized protein n=1 Tax=Paractinoplanes tereljensis TaxID=571912 RepID=A0A919TUA2_9ACTN|nr:hypothetical protein [Actinoplanes tereljensis]GIF23448.1 hypothetical protein Ate02nite_61780 [Actinoplanes tereljensis]